MLQWMNYNICYVVRYKQAYTLSIETLTPKDAWNMENRSYVMGPQNARRPRGKPRKKKIRAPYEKSSITSSRRDTSVVDVGGGGTTKMHARSLLHGSQKRYVHNGLSSNMFLIVCSSTDHNNRAARGRGIAIVNRAAS